jgi:hypothetical protein
MNIWAIVPVKPLGGRKAASPNSCPTSTNTATQLLARTVHLLVPLSPIRSVLVINRDARHGVVRVGREYGSGKRHPGTE